MMLKMPYINRRRRIGAPIQGITFIGSNSGVIAIGGGTGSVLLPGSLVENDIVIALLAADLSIGSNISSPGWTVLQQDAGSTIPGYVLAWKRMLVTPDTSIIINQNGFKQQAVAVQAFRGVNETTAIDAQATPATGSTGMPNPPSITTITNNALVLAVGAMDDDASAGAATAPSGYDNLTAAETADTATNNATVFLASKLVVTAGAEDPGSFGGTGDDQWWAHTFALRPK